MIGNVRSGARSLSTASGERFGFWLFVLSFVALCALIVDNC